MPEQPRTFAALLETLALRFERAGLWYGHGTDNAWDEACYLVQEGLGLDPELFENSLSQTPTAEQTARIQALAERRVVDREPVAYLTGRAWFAGQQFRIDRRALIPRSPIAELIQNRFEPLLRAPPEKILDLCCGSGCIGIASALAFPEARLDLADLSGDALDLARENVRLHNLESRTRLLRGDLFENLDSRYDLILCNPPYVGQEEFAELPPEYHHEPGMGLVSADTGLAIPLAILAQAADYLTESGVLIMEVGYSDALLSSRLPDVPFLWLEFDHGGQGVFLLTRKQLLQYRERFREQPATANS